MTEFKILSEAGKDFAHFKENLGKDKTIRESSYYPDSFLAPWNPDDLWQKDSTYSIYEDMLKDDQVSVATTLKKDLVLASGWDIVPGEEEQDDLVYQLQLCLSEDPEVPFEDCLYQILSAYDFGFSVSEKIFKKNEDGKLTLKNIKTRHPGTWLINTDKYGNVERYEQLGAGLNVRDIDRNYLIHYINNPSWQNPYGTSDLRAAYAAYFIKSQIIRYYAIFIEKSASPTPIAKYPSGLPDAAITKLHNSIKKFQSKTALTVPREVEIDFLESKSNGEAFIKGINIFNMFIGRSLLIPDLLGFQGSETSGGSFNLGENQMEVFFKHISKRRQIIESIVNKEILKPIIVYNYGFVENYPKFKLRPVSDKAIIGYAKLWLEAIKSQGYKPTHDEINHFRGIINFPESDEEMIEEPIEVIPENPMEEPPEDDGDDIEIEDQGPNEKTVVEIDNKCGKEKHIQEYKYKLPKGDYHKKVDFNRIEKMLDSSLDYLKAVFAPIITEIIDDLTNQISKKRIIENKKVDKIDTIKIRKTNKLRKVLNDSLKDVYKKGKTIAQYEILNKNVFAEPIVDETFLKILEEENYNYIKDWEYNLSKQARVEIISAVKDGRPIDSVITTLRTDLTDSAAVSTERYARTKLTEVMNKGRMAYFEESKIVDGYQYSAILDKVTTNICRNLNGKKFKKGTEPVPPMHFNCRSVLIPITIFEDYKPDTKIGDRTIDKFLEDEGAPGFPKK